MTTGNGPVSFVGNSTKLQKNPHSWTKLGHVLYIDQPVGTGFSTASEPYPIDFDRVTSDFHKWLQSFFSQFPHLQSKRVHIIGESFAGYYVPYFASAIVNDKDSFPLNLHSVSMGDPTIGNPAAMTSVTVGSFLQSRASVLQLPDDVLEVFADAEETCGFNAVLQQANIFPPKGPIQIPGNPDKLNTKKPEVANVFNEACLIHPATAGAVETSIMNSTCDGPCAVFSTALDYLQTTASSECFDQYDITNDCSTIDPSHLLHTYFSRPDVQTALNIPQQNTPFTFTSCNNRITAALTSKTSLPNPPTYSILPDLATTHNVPIHIYTGDNDLLINHIGTKLVLQNMTWNGAQGFSQKPDRVFYADNAAPELGREGANVNGPKAGTWGVERGLSYHLFDGAGHSVFAKKRRETFAFVRDVVVGG